MEHIAYDKQNERKIERFTIILFTLYSWCMLFLSYARAMGRWVSLTMLATLAVSWIVYAGKYKDYRFRIIFTTVMMQISMVVYALQAENVSPILALSVTFALFTGFYGVEDALPITMISSAIIFFYHIVVKKSIVFSDMESTVSNLMHMANIFLAQYVIGIWVRKRNESNQHTRETIEDLKRAEQSKDDFLANVSHEIRTPINTICGMTEMLLEEKDSKKMHEDIINIQSASRNLMSVVSDILDFSELQSEKVELEEEAYDITAMISDVINMTLAKKNEKNIELIVNCDANIPRVLYGDEKKIRRIVLNVVSNALKFTKEGCVSIHVTSRRESYGVNLAFTIKDTGIGMKEESLEKLFSSFNQVDPKRNREEGGLGLGLAISRALAQRMGGVITVKSKYQKGTTVKIVIPQKVLDNQPIVSIRDRDNLNVAVYINMEQFKMPEIRDEYAGMIQNMITQLHANCLVCRNLAELKRRHEQEKFGYIFISWVEYLEDTEYFNELAKQIKVVIIIDAKDDKDIESPDICRIYKPFYILPIAAVVNGDVENVMTGQRIRSEAFVAPDAKILVVDDNEMNLLVIESLLEKYRIQVVTASSGRAALEKIETMDYDFVFMDHMMPEMDGVDTLHRIRNKANAYYHKVPIIALTANAIAGARERFLAEGFTDFIEKPVEVAVLERVLRRNLPLDKLLPVEAECKSKQDDVEAESVIERGVETQAELSAKEPQVILDTEMGLLYCGGEAGYRKVLTCYCETGHENLEKIAELYREEDWENYTIAVHGVKSSMLSIGAAHVSELAKKLEMAGKSADIGYIKANHEEMLGEYARVIEYLKESPYVDKKETEISADAQETVIEVDAEELPELTDELFQSYIEKIEQAMFALDGVQMLAIVTELEGYQYEGVVLREQLTAVRRKTEMSDYMSAVEVLVKLRERLSNNAQGGEMP